MKAIVVVILTMVMLLGIASVALAEDCTCNRVPDTTGTTCTCTTNVPTRRVCGSGPGVVEFFPPWAALDEAQRYGEAHDNFCMDLPIGIDVHILLWTPELGHAGPTAIVEVTSEGPPIMVALSPKEEVTSGTTDQLEQRGARGPEWSAASPKAQAWQPPVGQAHNHLLRPVGWYHRNTRR